MHNRNLQNRVRRSSRVPATIPILVTSLEPGTHFSEVCETLVVSAHGCALRSRIKLDAGVPLHLHSREGRETTGQVVSCHPIGSNTHTWKLGARLDRPDNFWGLREYPQDWAALLGAPPSTPMVPESRPQPATRERSASTHSSELILEPVGASLSEDDLKNLIVRAVRPLQAEIVNLQEKLARQEANRSRFDVSLSSIPPELEQQLEARLQKELGPKVVNEARQQSAELLRAAQATIEQRTAQAYEGFVQRVGDELQVVGQRAQDISAHISENVRQQIALGVRELQKKVVEGDDHLRGLTGQLFEFVQQKLHEEHNHRSAELEQLRTAVSSESQRLHEHIDYLDARIGKLDGCARALESSLDQRLQQMADETVSRMRGELQTAADCILKELSARAVRELGNQLDEACGNMKIVQKGIITSASDSMKVESRSALEAFERSMGQQTEIALDRWQQILAGGLNGLVKSLGDQFRMESGSPVAKSE